MKTINVRLSDHQLEMLEEIKTGTGLTNTTEVIRFIIVEKHNKVNPPYRRNKKNEEVSRVDEFAKELEGRVFEDNGETYCNFKVYEQTSKKVVHIGELTLPLEDLTQDVVFAQYRDLEGNTGSGAKEICLEILEKKNAVSSSKKSS